MNVSLPGPMKRVIRRHRPACSESIADHPSQRRSLSKDLVAHVPVQRFLCADVDFDPEQPLEIFNQPGMIQQTSAWFPRY